MNEIVFKSAVELAQMIRDRQVSAIAVLEAHLDQIARLNPKLHAICTLDEANARIRAKQADEALARGENWGALHGVPVLATPSLRCLKDDESLHAGSSL